jgi:hypothetical protein
MLAAAAVAALIGGTVAVAHVATDHRHQPPATSVPAPTPAPTTHRSEPPTQASKPPVRTQSKATTGGGAGNTVQVPSDLEAWILAQPHPQLPSCAGHFGILGRIVPAHLTGNSVPDELAHVNCTLGSQRTEYDVYGVVGDHYGLVYRVPTDATTNGITLANSGFAASGTTLTVTLDGYAQGDAMCCPSSEWSQAYTFDGTNVSQGPLVQTSGPNLVTFTGVGPVQLGMTAAQVHAAEPSLQRHTFGQGCMSYYGSAGDMQVTFVPSSDTIYGIDAPDGYVTDAGIRVGSTPDQIRAAYAGRHIEQVTSQGGQVLLVQGPSSWLGFVLGNGSRVQGISLGEHDFAAQFEYCVGPMPS